MVNEVSNCDQPRNTAKSTVPGVSRCPDCAGEAFLGIGRIRARFLATLFMVRPGREASVESAEASADAERLLDQGKAKYAELANASDEQIDQLVASTRETWDDLSNQIEGGWTAMMDKVKSLFS